MLDKSFIKKPNFELKILHDKRIEAIISFGDRNRLELFGYGWENTKNLPIFFQKKLSPILNRIKPTPIEDKISKMSNYKFAICFENGDVTAGSIYEKVILAGFIDTLGAGICGGKVGFQIAAHSVIVQGKALIIRKI